MSAMREAASDFYYNSWRLVPANAVWGFLLVVLIIATAIWLPAAVLVSVLAIPVAGLYRMTAKIARGAGTGFSDFLSGMRHWAVRALAIGLVVGLLATVFTANVFIGLEIGGVGGWVFSALALYADIGLAMFLVAAWPILLDPVREDLSVRERLRLAAVVCIARPGRMFALTVIIAALLLVSTVLFAALLTVSLAYVSLLATRFVLPAADRLEGRKTKVLPV